MHLLKTLRGDIRTLSRTITQFLCACYGNQNANPEDTTGLTSATGTWCVISEVSLARKQPCTRLKQLTFPGNPSKATRLAPARRFTATANLSRAVNQSQRGPQLRGATVPGQGAEEDLHPCPAPLSCTPHWRAGTAAMLLSNCSQASWPCTLSVGPSLQLVPATSSGSQASGLCSTLRPGQDQSQGRPQGHPVELTCSAQDRTGSGSGEQTVTGLCGGRGGAWRGGASCDSPNALPSLYLGRPTQSQKPK